MLERLKGNQLLSVIPVIVVTVRDPELAEHRALDQGAAMFLQKPVKADQLIAAIRGVIEKSAAD